MTRPTRDRRDPLNWAEILRQRQSERMPFASFYREALKPGGPGPSR